MGSELSRRGVIDIGHTSPLDFVSKKMATTVIIIMF